MTRIDRTEQGPPGRTELLGMTQQELEFFFSEFGKERFRAVQVMKWMYQGLEKSFEGMSNLSKSLRHDLGRLASITCPELLSMQRSLDDTRKFLMRFSDGCCAETVLIPSDDHDTLCVSTQVGCAMGCRICRTGQMGLVRSLTAGEIVAQVLEVRRREPQSRITNVVLMGMGEPLANFDQTVRAIGIMIHPNGPQISWRRLTVSTVGLPHRIRQLGQAVRAKLAVSLNAVTDEQRSSIMPINRTHPISELMAALREYPLPRRDRITIEYVMIDGFNDSDSDARQLVRLLSPIPAKVNLIPFNEELSEDMKSPKPERVARFQEILTSKSLVAIVRKSRGRDILAACGQLVGQAGGTA